MTDSERATVLVVDDDPTVLELFEQFLADYDVRTATDGAAALESAPGTDVVLLDRGLPDRSGEDVLAELRERGSTVPVVMVSGTPPDDDGEAGYDDYILKPPEPGAVQAAVADALA